MGENSLVDVGKRYSNETHRILNDSEDLGITLRLLGAQAIREHCPKFGHLLDEIGRSYVDIDFVALREQRQQLKDFFSREGYEIDRQVLIAAEGTRYIFQNQDALVVDVFIDTLDFCHRMNLRDRLQLDYPTIPLADLLLSKLQIVKIAEKDLQDMLVLILEHEISERDDPKLINAKYISILLAADWGFYHTVNQNFDRLMSLLPFCDWLNIPNKATISERIDKMKALIEAEKKTFGWRWRSKIGTRIRWYKQVSERGQVF
jgi:hypothetical protein